MEGKPKQSDFWAKLEEDEKGDVVGWHPLSSHCADVAATVEKLLSDTLLGDRLAALLGWGELSVVHVERLAALAALHDAGKVNHGFQNRSLDSASPRGGHVAPIVNFLKASPDGQAVLHQPLRLRPILSWFEDEQTFVEMILATFGHHGRPVLPEPKFRKALWEDDDRRNPTAELGSLRDRLETWFPEAFDGDARPFARNAEFQHAFNGVLTLADWLGSDTDFFPFAGPENAGELRNDKATEAVRTMGFDADPARRQLGDSPPDFDAVSDFDPYDIQRTCLDLPVGQQGSLTILESDTGSGKTEAALARFLRLFHAGAVDGMYFALPTRSAATELHERVHETVARAFPDEASRPPVVQAVPGYIKIDDQRATRLPNFDVLWDDDPEARRRKRRWAAEHSKRYLAGTIAVGTIDQVLLSGLRINHAHLRGSALLRHLLVVDEIHASDTYMTRLLESVLDHHLNAGGHAFLMSATLGSHTRTRFATGALDDAPSAEAARDEPYPLVTHVSADRESPESIHAASSDFSKTVDVSAVPIADRPQTVAEQAYSAAKRGARVLVIRNLVDDCRETQKELESIAENNGGESLLFDVDGVVAPHHSRFATEDRTKLDEAIESTFGKNAPDDATGTVCVATQTVEQSLDIDADLLLTDLCPVDVMLQRIGRLHRHQDRTRPDGFERAETVVLTPEDRDLGRWIESSGNAPGDHGLGTVYGDLRILEATWRLVDDHEAWTIPEMNRELVERGTHPEILQEITKEQGEPWENHEQQILARRYADKWKGSKWLLDRTKPFGDETFPRGDELEEKIKTRLGQEDLQVEFEETLLGPFGEGIAELTIPGWLFDKEIPDDTDLQILEQTDDHFRFDFAGKTFRYDRAGLTALS